MAGVAVVVFVFSTNILVVLLLDVIIVVNGFCDCVCCADCAGCCGGRTVVVVS